MRLLFFAQLRDATGCASADLPAPTPLTAEQLWTKLLVQFPSLAPHRSCVRLARNCEYADDTTRFADADEVALIPPVSGG